MIKDNQRQFNMIRVLLDAVITAISYLFAWYVKFKSPFSKIDDSIGRLPFKSYFYALVFIIPAIVFLYGFFKLYTPKRGVRDSGAFGAIVKGNAVGVGIFFLTLYIINQPDFSRSMVLIFACTNVVATSIAHYFVKLIISAWRRSGHNVRYVLLVGYSRTTEEYIERLIRNPQWGLVVKGILDDEVPAGTTYRGIKVLGRIDNLNIILPNSKLDEITITLGLKDYARLSRIVDLCEKSGIHTSFIPDYMSVIPSMPYTEDVQGLPVINIRYVPLNEGINRFIKRTGDIIFSIFGIVVTSPVMLVCALLVKFSGPGPVIFKQERVGRHNKNFNMYKFRSMKVQSPDEEAKEWTTKNDPRVTGVGRFIRKTSIDELPQLFNILKGDMSLVGPRPERPQFVDQFKEEIPRYMIKHQVRPGLTGWAQVNGFRGDTSIYKRIEHDLFYIENWSVWLDIKIIFMTFFVGFVNKNAY